MQLSLNPVWSPIDCDALSVNDVSVLKEIAISKKLLRATKALYFLRHIITSLFKSADNKEEFLLLNKTLILNRTWHSNFICMPSRW